MKWVVCDIETVSVKKNAVVPCVGFTVFDPQEDYTYQQLLDNGLMIKLDVSEQVQKGRDVMRETVEWWGQQDPEAQKCIQPAANDIKMIDFHKELEKLGDIKDATWYFRGPHFDAAILEHLFDDFGIQCPWMFWAVRDTRTWLEALTGNAKPEMDIPEGFIAHDPVHDVCRDAWMMLEIIQGRYE